MKFENYRSRFSHKSYLEYKVASFGKLQATKLEIHDTQELT